MFKTNWKTGLNTNIDYSTLYAYVIYCDLNRLFFFSKIIATVSHPISTNNKLVMLIGKRFGARQTRKSQQLATNVLGIIDGDVRLTTSVCVHVWSVTSYTKSVLVFIIISRRVRKKNIYTYVLCKSVDVAYVLYA